MKMYKVIALATALLIGASSLMAQTSTSNAPSQQEAQAEMPLFSLIELPYAPDALAPTISEATILLHYGKHLRGYVDNLNRLKRSTAFEHTNDLEKVVRESRGSIYNNAGQILNHNLYFTQFTPGGKALQAGKLKDLIENTWGSLEAFQQDFETEAGKLFGSGWMWLAQTPEGGLALIRESNGGNPLSSGLRPLLGFDLWEHAYYLDYQNRRADHIKSLWKIVDWTVVASRLN